MNVLAISTFSMFVALAFPIGASAAKDSHVTPPATHPASASVRAEWVDRVLQQRVRASNATPWKSWLARQRRDLTSMPAGTRIYNLPGFAINNGAASSAYDDESKLSKTNSGYSVTRRGRVIGTYPLTATVIAMPIAYWIEVRPGQVVPKKLRDRRPSLIAP